MSTSTVRRAFELARSGTCQGLGDIRKKLKAEGYESIDAHLAGKSLTKQLTVLMRSARDSELSTGI
jgi:hypothetical protein